jgi:hypothetical protein
MNVQVQHLAAGLALLTLVPVSVYAVGHSLWAVVALLNVVLVAACLYYMFGPEERETAHVAG